MDTITGSFRSEVFGGFNRRDVTVYIEKLAAERNRYKSDAEKLSDKVEELSDTIEELRSRVSELTGELEATAASAKQQEESYRLTAISEAETVLNTLESRYGILREEIIAASGRLRTELCDAGDRIAGLASQLESAEETFRPLHLTLTQESVPNPYFEDMLTESDGEDSETSVYAQNQRQAGDMLMESDGEDTAEDTAETTAEAAAEVSFASLRKKYPEIKWEKSHDE